MPSPGSQTSSTCCQPGPHDFSLSDSSMDDILLDEALHELGEAETNFAAVNLETSALGQSDSTHHVEKGNNISLSHACAEKAHSKMYTLFSQSRRSDPNRFDENNNECKVPLRNITYDRTEYCMEETEAASSESKPNVGSEISKSYLVFKRSADYQSTSSEISHLSLSTEDGSICRICHEGESKEALISPCKCTGTMAMIHQTCVERWLGAANLNRCEVCGFQYITKRTPRPLLDWLKKPGRSMDKRNLVGDVACFVLLSPLAAISAWLCITGALHYRMYDNTQWETAGLCTLSAFLIIIYIIWCAVAIRYHIKVFLRWRQTNQVVKVVNINMCKMKGPDPNGTSTVFSMVSKLFGPSYASVFSSSQNVSTREPCGATGSKSSPVIQVLNDVENSADSVPLRMGSFSRKGTGLNPQISLSDTMVLLMPDFKWQNLDLKETAV